MSKLTDILKNFRLEQVAKSRRTVTQFAEELGKDVGIVLEQFAEAGIVFSGPDDEVLSAHSQKLLDWLKSKHSSRSKKKITLRRNPDFSPYGCAWRAVAGGENGAEWDFLSEFAGMVILGAEIDPNQQRLVNLIVAKSVIQGALPLRRVGRPKESRTDDLAMVVSTEYWDFLDSGRTSVEAVERLSAKFHKTERQIFRYVEAKRQFFGDTKEARDQKRKIFRMMASIGDQRIDPFASMYAVDLPDLSSLTDEDYMDHLGEMIAKEAGRFPDVKEPNFIDSDMSK